jgi:hypothetical protein
MQTRTYDELHKQRCELDVVVYDILKTAYLPWLRAWWATHKLPPVTDTNHAFVMYEMRPHPNMEFIILSTLYFAGPCTSLIVYCSVVNIEHIQHILGHNYTATDIRLVEEGDTGREEGRRVYNKTLQSADFWESIPVEHIILCEMDGYFRRPITDDMWTYDYVCCPWPWDPKLIGGGGVSLRRRSAMLRIAHECPHLEQYAQDIWVATGVNELKLHAIACFSEAAFFKDPIAVHQWWTFFDPERLTLPEILLIGRSYLTLELPLADHATLQQAQSHPDSTH